MDKTLSSVPAASRTPFTTKSAPLGLKRHQLLRPVLSCQFHLSCCDTLGRWSASACIETKSHLLFCQLAVDVPKTHGPPQTAGFFFLYISSLCLDQGRSFVFVCLDHDDVKSRGSWMNRLCSSFSGDGQNRDSLSVSILFN